MNKPPKDSGQLQKSKAIENAKEDKGKKIIIMTGGSNKKRYYPFM
jgi:hypothetical protein